MTYYFVYYDGNNGDEIGYETIEAAVDAAETKWGYLTDREKDRYTSDATGSQFMVTDEEGHIFWEPEVGLIESFIGVFKDGECVGSIKTLGLVELWDAIATQHPELYDILDEHNVEVFNPPILPLLTDDEVIKIMSGVE